VCERAPAPRRFEPVPDLNALNSLDSHESTGETRIETPVPVDIGPQAWGKTSNHDFHNATESVAFFVGCIYLCDHGAGSSWICTSQGIFIQPVNVRGGGQFRAFRNLHSSHGNRVRDNIDTEL
jgi:hypothetical protein